MNGIKVSVKKTLVLANSISPNVVGAKFTDSDFGDLGLCSAAGFNMLVGADD